MVNNWQHYARLYVSSVFALLGFVRLNVWFNTSHPARCADCHAHVGIPFAYYDAGGVLGGEAILWLGLTGDLLVVLGLAFGVVLLWDRRSKS